MGKTVNRKVKWVNKKGTLDCMTEKLGNMMVKLDCRKEKWVNRMEKLDCTMGKWDCKKGTSVSMKGK